MASDDEDDRKRKSRKHDGSSRSSKHRSSRDSDRRRRESEDRHKNNSSRHKERERRDHDHHSRDERKSTRGKDNDDAADGSRSGRGGSKLTEEEERLYAKAQEFLAQKEKGHHKQHGKDSKRYDSSDSDDKKRHRDRKEHRHKRDDNDRDKSSRHKKKSKHHHDRHDEKDKKKKKKHGPKSEESFKDKASKIDSSKLVSLGDIIHEPPTEQLDPEVNYFSHNSHLRLFLYRKFGIYFEDLTSDESHHAFKEFTNTYNAGKLEKVYYDASGLLPQGALDQCQRTKHQWKFRTNRLEEQSLDMVRAGVKKQTEYNNTGGTAITNAAVAGKSVSNQIGPRKGNHMDDSTSRRKTPAEMAAQRHSDKQHKQRIQLGNEELYGVGGKADPGWERNREKKREQSQKLHGAANDRESEAWGGAELNDDAIYGTSAGVGGRGGRGEASFEEAVARKRSFRERKTVEKAARTSELLKKEDEKQKKMFEMLGLTGMKPGEKIKIAPRNDTG